MVWSGWSLRTKLVVTCVLVQMAAAALLIGVSTQILQRTVLEQARSEIRQVVVLLDQAIAAPMAQRDYATLQQTLDLVRSDESIVYLVLQDHRGKRIAASGWDPVRALPPRDGQDIDLRRADTTLHLSMPITLAGQVLGRVDLGLSTLGLREARADFLRQSLSVGAAALVLSTLALAGLAYAITRHLARLALASQRVGLGEFDVQVPVTTHDEIGHLGASFNAMASALKQRVQALEESRAQQREHLDEARSEQSRLTTLLGAMRGGIVFVDEHGKLIYANASFARIWSLGELTAGTMLPDIVQRMLPQVDPAHVGYLEAMCQRGASEQRSGGELHTLDGRIITQRVQPVAQAGSGSGCIWFHDDVTQERQTQQRAHQALHDPLTGLYNRRGFYESLQLALAQAAMDRTPTSLLFIDLDDFKHANDVAGHRVGDEILAAVARALTGQMRKGELVGRLGGDEFAVLCPGIPAEGAGAIAARLVTAISALQWEAAGQILHVGCSVGVATCPLDASMADELVACADAAMYEAKAAGKNGWAAYRDDPSRSESEAVRVNWNAQIHRALQEQRFVLHFQSVHRASDSRIAYYEALVRMVDESDPARVILPAEFVTRAEASGKIRLIDRWVFEACIKRLAGLDEGVFIAANLSARSLEDSSFPGFLRDMLQRHDVDPRRLHIELTETSAIGDPLSARQLINALRGLGCAVHLDDFGSGFSSFSHLKLLDVDAIKIDGAFVRNLQSDASNRLFVASMIEIAHSLSKTVVAEHVEDEGTLAVLRKLGVDYVQGFHLGRPGPGIGEARARGHLQVVPDVRGAGGGAVG